MTGAWVMGYAVGYEQGLLPPNELNWASLTHLAVGRATPNADGSLNTTFDIDAVSGPAWAKGMVQQAHAHNVKAILMLRRRGRTRRIRGRGLGKSAASLCPEHPEGGAGLRL